MRYFWQFSIAAVVCFIITGCAGRYAQPPRETVTFDYVPTAEAPPGSADVTFAIVGAKFIAPTVYQQAMSSQQGIVPPSAAPPPLLFQELVSNMTKDFGEVLTSRGFTVKGSYPTLDKMIYPDKEGSDLILTAQVKLSADTNSIRYTGKTGQIILTGCVLTPIALAALISSAVTPKEGDQKVLLLIGVPLLGAAWMSGLNSVGVIPSGEVQFGCEVELEAYEGLTGELMWSKKIPIPSFTAMPKATIRKDPGLITWQQLMEIDNKFYSDIGRVLETQYDEILKQIYVYLDPREMAIVKNQAMELRKMKVY